MAESIPMMATTIINSIRVKPWVLCLLCILFFNCLMASALTAAFNCALSQVAIVHFYDVY